MYLERQTQFGDIPRPREGSAGVFLDSAQAVTGRVRVADKDLSRTAHRRIVVLLAGGVRCRWVGDGVPMTANSPSAVAESASSTIDPDAGVRRANDGELSARCQSDLTIDDGAVDEALQRRANLAANLPDACAGCDQLIVTGHSLGAALAVLAAPDIAKNVSVVPEPKLTTFGGPRPGLHDFVVSFNLLIDSCFRVVNLFDIVPHLPLALPGLPYEHVGVQVAVNSGGSIDQTHRHSLDAYRAGLTSLISTQPAWAA